MPGQRWSAARAQEWYDGQPWLVGCNFTPSTAINQLEMWQAETFDAEVIDRELGWAAGLGFNSVRVFLHDLAWKVDPEGFKGRVDRFLGMASTHGIRTMLVLLDDCWFPDPRPGPQPDPVPGVHNSGWVQSPGQAVVRDRSRWEPVEAYVKDVLITFSDDPRVVVWDLYNEPGNYFLPHGSKPLAAKLRIVPPLFLQHVLLPSPTLPLLREVFRWARGVDPSQPLTAGTWFFNRGLNRFQHEHSDVTSFHHYAPPKKTERVVERLARLGRPLLCTEYMGRTLDSRFESHLPLFQRHRVAAYNWGLVAGRTQTQFSWQDPPQLQANGGTAEPPTWFHDILRPDGTPYDEAEVAFLRGLLRG